MKKWLLGFLTAIVTVLMILFIFWLIILAVPWR